MVSSSLPLASTEPSGLKATLRTARSCPHSGSPIGCPVETSQRRIVRSPPPLASIEPSGLKATSKTPNLKMFDMPAQRLADRLPGRTSQRRIVASCPHSPASNRPG